MTSTNEKSRLAGNQATLETLPDGQNSTTANGARLREVDPVVGWFSLAAGVKPSRTRQQKRGWNRSTK
jgi:hypothetical protein